jgi:hypothetical protein
MNFFYTWIAAWQAFSTYFSSSWTLTSVERSTCAYVTLTVSLKPTVCA